MVLEIKYLLSYKISQENFKNKQRKINWLKNKPMKQRIEKYKHWIRNLKMQFRMKHKQEKKVNQKF